VLAPMIAAMLARGRLLEGRVEGLDGAAAPPDESAVALLGRATENGPQAGLADRQDAPRSARSRDHRRLAWGVSGGGVVGEPAA